MPVHWHALSCIDKALESIWCEFSLQCFIVLSTLHVIFEETDVLQVAFLPSENSWLLLKLIRTANTQSLNSLRPHTLTALNKHSLVEGTTVFSISAKEVTENIINICIIMCLWPTLWFFDITKDLDSELNYCFLCIYKKWRSWTSSKLLQKCRFFHLQRIASDP